MMDGGSRAFLQQAYANNRQQYLASLTPGARGWDLCVLTASSVQQAAMYERQLDARRATGSLPPDTRFAVVADPPGRRIGSGGATLRVLRMLADGDLCEGEGNAAGPEALRVLIIHSGGDSRRLPHCSATGKLFARIPRALPDGRASTLFDEFLVSLSGVARGLPAGVLVASGDVLLVFDHLQLDLHGPGVTGVAMAAPAETGTEHGVYVTDDGRAGLRPPRLRAFLHKPSMVRLQVWDAIAADGTVSVDSGLVWLDAPTMSKLAALAKGEAVGAFCGAGGGCPETGLNLYGDLLMPLVASTEREAYLGDTSDGAATPALRAAREAIWQRLRGVSMSVQCLRPAVFAHFGTSHEYWRLAADSPGWANTWGWTRETASWMPEAREDAGERPASINAVVEGPVTGGMAPGLVVDSWIGGGLALEGAALIAGVHTERALRVGQEIVVHQLPVGDGKWVTRVLGLEDDPKEPWDDPRGTFVHRPWAEWLAEAGLEAETVWLGVPEGTRTLWNARLYPVSADRDEGLSLSLGLQDPRGAGAAWRPRWTASERMSLAESFAEADGERLLAELGAVEDEAATRRFLDAVEAEEPAAEAKALLGRGKDATERRAALAATRLEAGDPVLRLRGYAALAAATRDDGWEDRAFATLARMIQGGVGTALPSGTAGGSGSPCRGAVGERVRVEAAARIDFGGGWTDTPPYSIERGGTVLNAAITFSGRPPIAAEAERLAAPRLILESGDIGAAIEPERVEEVLDYANPADPFALLKAAVVLRGMVRTDADRGAPLAVALGDGGGLRLRTETSIPRGSGLGTSSILAGAVLACLARLEGEDLPREALFDEVLCLEQMLTTGGGWQDQVGGLTGGIKLITTGPGLPQEIRVAPLALGAETEAALRERLVLVYTGQQRLAKNLLRAVMGRWMARDPEMVWIQGEIARLARAMREALEAGDVGEFGKLLGEHWALNKRMDPGCTNGFIDGLFETLAPYVDGGKLAGAGGGGFAIAVTRDGVEAEDIARALEQAYPGTAVAAWPSAIASEGLAIR